MTHTSSSLLKHRSILTLFRTGILLKITTVFSLVILPVTWGPWGVLTAEESSDTGVSMEQLDSILDFLDGMETYLESQIVPMESIVESNENAEKLLGWVQSNTNWASYIGLLKGSKGTYASKMGNLVDRSVFFAWLLQKSGKVVRLAHVQSDEGQYELLKKAYFEQMPAFELRSWRDLNQAMESNDFDVESISKESGISQEELLAGITQLEESSRMLWDSLTEKTEKQSAMIVDTLPLASDKAVTVFNERDYFYVEYRENDVWKAVCPVFGFDVPDAFLASKTQYYSSVDEIPERLKHRVCVTLEIDQLKDGEINEKTVVSKSFNTADISNQQIGINLGGPSLARANELSTDETLSDSDIQQEILKTLSTEDKWYCEIKTDDDVSEVMGFTSEGELYRPGQDGALGVGDKMGSALSALSFAGSAEQPPKAQLTGVRFIFETFIPGTSAAITETREVYALENTILAELMKGEPLDDSVAKDRALRCVSLNRLLVQTSKWDPSLMASSQIEQYRKSHQAVRYYKRLMEAGREAEFNQKIEKVSGNIPQTDPALLNFALIRSFFPKHSDRVYLPNANLIRSTQWLSSSDSSVAISRAIDVLTNSVDTFSQEKEEARLDRIKMGVFDTLAEKYIAHSAWGQEQVENTSSIFEHSHQDVTLQIDANNGRNSGSYLSISAAEDEQKWYRVNAKTGETLGMVQLDNGMVLGAAVVEYKTILFTVVMTFLGCWGGAGATAINAAGCGLCGIIAGLTAIPLAVAAGALAALAISGWGMTAVAGANIYANAGTIATVCGAAMAVGGRTFGF